MPTANANKSGSTVWRPITYTHNGKAEQVAVELPKDLGSIADEEATTFVQTLEDNQLIAHESEPLSPRQTHQVVKDSTGRKRLIRKRYSSV